MKSNCLFFAIKKIVKHGGYLIIRKSRDGWFPHFIWASDLNDARIEHWQPVDPKIKSPLDYVWFKGYVKLSEEKLIK